MTKRELGGRRLLWLIVKLILSVLLAGVILHIAPSDFQRLFRSIHTEHGAVMGAIAVVMGGFVIFGLIYSVLTLLLSGIRAWAEDNTVYVYSDGHREYASPLTVLVFLVLWIAVLYFLNQNFGGAPWYDGFVAFIYAPLFLWIDILKCIAGFWFGR